MTHWSAYKRPSLDDSIVDTDEILIWTTSAFGDKPHWMLKVIQHFR
jgi:hypothetical protein